MSERPVDQLGSQVDVSPTLASVSPTGAIDLNDSILRLLHSILQVQQQQLQLTQEMVKFAHDTRKRQHAELEAWQRDNLGIVERCREVLSTLSQVHAGTLGDMADYINENAENLLESDFSINEFVDRFGPRLHHLSAMLGIFRQLTAATGTQPGEENAGK